MAAEKYVHVEMDPKLHFFSILGHLNLRVIISLNKSNAWKALLQNFMSGICRCTRIVFTPKQPFVFVHVLLLTYLVTTFQIYSSLQQSIFD